MKIIAIVQARTFSTRFPKKILKVINNKSVIELVIRRLSLSKKINQIIVAVPSGKKDNYLHNFLKKKNFFTFRGSEKNVLSRYYKTAVHYKANVIVRITSDCPLIDPEIVDKTINFFLKSKKDYITNASPPTYPDGLDVEVFNFKCLQKCFRLAKSKYDLENVTPFIRNSGLFKLGNIKNSKNYSNFRWTLDYKNDFKLIKKIFLNFKPDICFSWKKIIKYLKQNPEIQLLNNKIKRNSGTIDNVGQKLWREAKQIIPGGNMFLSKRPELFLPDKWPTYYSKAKGCYIWTLDNKKLIDMCLMGVGTNILGYSNHIINKSVNNAILDGNMSSLNCPEEVELAKKLLKLHPWADMVKFARSGGEANAIAIRIARAAAKKDNVAFCGYHGWHDWYLSSNINNSKNLDSQLIPGLKIQGVPKKLKNTAFPFKFNNIKQLKKLIKTKNIGIIKMEVLRNIEPKNNFLKKIKSLADKNNIILIFDECTSGFRANLGGIHKLYKINPDMAIFGKALGNGHAITAIIGKKKIMEFANNSFISSTFWSERSGIIAGIKTLELMKKKKTWVTISKIGKKIEKKWLQLGKKYNLNIKCYGLPSIKSFVIISKNWIKYKTFISQEMLKKGFLASNIIYVSICHNKQILNSYFRSLDLIFKIISKFEKNNEIDILLETPVSNTGIQRQN